MPSILVFLFFNSNLLFTVNIDEEEAEKAFKTLHGRYYAGRMLTCENCPVTDFKEARCRQFDDSQCSRGVYCNFLHVREPSRDLRKYLEKVCYIV